MAKFFIVQKIYFTARILYFITRLFQTCGVNKTSTGKNSSRPAIMQNEKTIFEKEENAA